MNATTLPPGDPHDVHVLSAAIPLLDGALGQRRQCARICGARDEEQIFSGDRHHGISADFELLEGARQQQAGRVVAVGVFELQHVIHFLHGSARRLRSQSLQRLGP
jgi:hypothetical protein